MPSAESRCLILHLMTLETAVIGTVARDHARMRMIPRRIAPTLLYVLRDYIVSESYGRNHPVDECYASSNRSEAVRLRLAAESL
jgi:hypothetical protein